MMAYSKPNVMLKIPKIKRRENGAPDLILIYPVKSAPGWIFREAQKKLRGKLLKEETLPSKRADFFQTRIKIPSSEEKY